MKRSPWKLSPLFSPHSIAVIGASPKGGAGSIVIRNLQRLGFAGTIQAFVPLDMLQSFKSQMEAMLGEGCCHVLSIRPEGGTVIWP